jgi:hypothetical protein
MNEKPERKDNDDDVEDDERRTPSDLRLKENVIRIGTTRRGLPFYTFNYVGRPERYAGVIAQDVLSIMPEAVSIADDGFYRVDYRRLQMRRLRLN